MILGPSYTPPNSLHSSCCQSPFLAYSVGTHSTKPGSTETPRRFQLCSGTRCKNPATQTESEAWTWASRPWKVCSWTRRCRNCRSSPCASPRRLCARCGLGGSSCAQVATARLFLVKIRVGYYLAICLPEFLDQLIDLASFGNFPVECPCILGSLSLTDIVQVNLQRNMMPKLRLLAKHMAAEFRVEESICLGLGT